MDQNTKYMKQDVQKQILKWQRYSEWKYESDADTVWKRGGPTEKR